METTDIHLHVTNTDVKSYRTH